MIKIDSEVKCYKIDQINAVLLIFHQRILKNYGFHKNMKQHNSF